MEKEQLYVLDDLNFYLDNKNIIHALIENKKHTRLKDLINGQIYDRVQNINSSDILKQYGIDKNNLRLVFMDKYRYDSICGTTFLKELAEMGVDAYPKSSIYRRLLNVRQSLVGHEDDSNSFTDYLSRAKFAQTQPVTLDEIKESCELLQEKYSNRSKKTKTPPIVTEMDAQILEKIAEGREF